jgi:hypothetical protein
VKSTVLALGLLSLLLMGRPAKADVATYEGLSSGAPIPNGYAGLNWNNFSALDTTGFEPSGYVNGVVSGTSVAYNGYGDPAAFSDSAFTLNSAYFTAAWNDGLNILVQGYLNSTLVNSVDFTVNTSGPTLETFNWLVDDVVFSSSGGTPHGYGGGGEHFAMDDLTFNAAVPEPSAIILLAIMLGMVGLMFRVVRKQI